MKRTIIFFLIAIIIAYCTEDKWYRTPSGLVYKVFPSNNKDSIASFGRTIKVNVIQKAGDTIIQNTYNDMPYYEMIMPYGNSYNPSATFPGLKKGDSVIVRQRVDSMLSKKIFEKLPPWLKKSDEWITTIKVLDVFINDSLLQADKQKEAEKFIAKWKAAGEQKIKNYLTAGHIAFNKTKDDVFVQASNSTTSDEVADTGKWVNIHFLVKTLNGKVLNNSRDTSKQKGPFGFQMGSGFFFPSIEHALFGKSKGSITTVYMPAVAIYGINLPKEVKKDDVLVFVIELLDVKDKAPAPTKKA